MTRTRASDEIDRCDGALVLHVDGVVECTAFACRDTHRDRHLWVVWCASEWTDCPCRSDRAAREGWAFSPAASG